jgi:penicillin-binding protein 2
MDLVVNGLRGTAKRIAADSPYRIGGKTGTAQVYKLGKDKVYKEDELPVHLRDHALFIAFAPVEEPRIAIAVVVEHGGAGSKAAAPVARAALDAWLEQEVRPEPHP